MENSPPRTLLVVRHAKSSWNDPSMDDFDRPLNDRGKRDAPAMAERLRKRGITPDGFLSSPARRAKKTAEAFMKVFGRDDDPQFIASLYHAPVDVFYDVVSQANDGHHVIAVFSHNPGITDFVNSLTDAIRVDNVPTTGIFAVKVHAASWADFRKADKEFLFFDYPKNQ